MGKNNCPGLIDSFKSVCDVINVFLTGKRWRNLLSIFFRTFATCTRRMVRAAGADTADRRRWRGSIEENRARVNFRQRRIFRKLMAFSVLHSPGETGSGLGARARYLFNGPEKECSRSFSFVLHIRTSAADQIDPAG